MYLLADNNVNVLDISQTILREFFTMTMLVDVSASKLPFTVLCTLLENEAPSGAWPSKVQREDIFDAMHKI